MAFPGDREPIVFDRHELTGAVGDSTTVLPIVVAVAALSDFSLAVLLLGFAAFQIVWGLYYGVPVSVEPMKALAALLIAGSLTVAEFRVAGLLAGVLLLAAGLAGALARVQALLGEPVVRGVQLAVALVLLRTGVDLGATDPRLAGVAAAVAVLAVGLGHRRGSALLVLLVATGVAALEVGLPAPTLGVPEFSPGVAVAAGVTPRTLEATGAQLAMTVGNAAVAASLLLSDYFDADVSPDELATSMGAMNLAAVPLGAMPMCHGSGGIAGKRAFGARTAGANLVLGALYAAAALLLVGVVARLPMAMIGVVLVLVAAELGRAGLETESLPVTVAVGVVGVAANVGIALLVGFVLHRLARRVAGRTSP